MRCGSLLKVRCGGGFAGEPLGVKPRPVPVVPPQLPPDDAIPLGSRGCLGGISARIGPARSGSGGRGRILGARPGAGRRPGQLHRPGDAVGGRADHRRRAALAAQPDGAAVLGLPVDLRPGQAPVGAIIDRIGPAPAAGRGADPLVGGPGRNRPCRGPAAADRGAPVPRPGRGPAVADRGQGGARLVRAGGPRSRHGGLQHRLDAGAGARPAAGHRSDADVRLARRLLRHGARGTWHGVDLDHVLPRPPPPGQTPSLRRRVPLGGACSPRRRFGPWRSATSARAT